MEYESHFIPNVIYSEKWFNNLITILLLIFSFEFNYFL